MEGLEEGEGRRLARRFSVVLVLCAALTLGAGFARLYLQRGEHLPDYARTPANRYAGFAALDDYATRAALFRDWLRGDGELEDVLARARSGLHPASLLVPLLVGLASLLAGSVPLAFALFSATAAVAAALLVVRLATTLARGREDPALAAAVGAVAGVLALAHVDAVRTAVQLHMDPFCNLWAVAAVALLIRVRAGGGAGTRALFMLVLATGPLVKISLFPLLALPAASAFLWPAEREGRASGAARALLAWALPPLAVWVFVLAWCGALHLAFHDMRDQATQFAIDRRYLVNFTLEMALLFQLFPLVFLLRPARPWSDGERVVWLALALVLVGTWIFRLPAIPRLYLPVTSFLAVLAAPRIVGRGSWWQAGVLAWVVANYALGAAILTGAV